MNRYQLDEQKYLEVLKEQNEKIKKIKFTPKT